jgi:7-cyano-7-deazaguanine synthase
MNATVPATRSELVCVVLSGGMDSTTLMAHYAASGNGLLAVTVDYGQRHRREIDAARDVAKYYGAGHIVVDLTDYGQLLVGSALTDPDVDVPEGHYAEESMRATVVPNRNAVLANIAVGIAVSRGASVVGMGMHGGDHAIYPDCRPEFVHALDRLVQLGNDGHHPPRIDAPFLRWTKTNIVQLAIDLRAPLGMSWSCYQGDNIHCGVCGTCYERREAFREAGVTDPTTYRDAVTEFAPPSGSPA